jgi:flagellar export protein FliJ
MEKKAQTDLVAVRNEYKKIEDTIKHLAVKRTENLSKCRDESISGLNVPMYKIYQTFLHKLDHDIEKAHMGLQKEKEKVKAQENILKIESIKKRTLETLKDSQLRNFIKNTEKEDQKFIDEMVTIRKGGKA